MSIISLKQALSYGTNELKRAKIESAQLDAEILISFLLECTREKLISNDQYPITNAQFNKYKKLIKKRAKHYPVAYLIGSKEFYGIDFFVNENVLVPRPETELLVEEVINYTKKLQAKKLKSYKLIEIGTGSGCIALSLAKYLPDAKITAVDVSEKALMVARKNRIFVGNSHGCSLRNVQFHKSNLFSNIKSLPDIIVANLPYLTKNELREPSIAKEPRIALYGGKNGLEIYEKLFKQIKRRLINNHSQLTIFLEIGEKQAKKIQELSKRYFPEAVIEVKKDLSRRDRVVIIKI